MSIWSKLGFAFGLIAMVVSIAAFVLTLQEKTEPQPVVQQEVVVIDAPKAVTPIAAPLPMPRSVIFRSPITSTELVQKSLRDCLKECKQPAAQYHGSRKRILEMRCETLAETGLRQAMQHATNNRRLRENGAVGLADNYFAWLKPLYHIGCPKQQPPPEDAWKDFLESRDDMAGRGIY